MKNRILEAAAQEMNERGIKFTIDSVALRLGISKKTVYQYYDTKDDLISAIVDAVIQDLKDQEQEVLQADTDFTAKLFSFLHIESKRFGKINDWVMEDVKKRRPADWDRIERFRQDHSRVTASLLEDGVKSGHIRPVHAAIASQMLLGAVGQLIDYRFLSSNNITFYDALQVVADIFLHGVLINSPNRHNV